MDSQPDFENDSDSTSDKKDFELTPEALEKLLLFLSPDRKCAADEYEKVRLKLIAFFESRGCHSPTEYSDITINRVAKKLSEGTPIYAKTKMGFIYGVAYKILHEYWNDQTKNTLPIDDLLPTLKLSSNPEEERRQQAERLRFERKMDCLDSCMEKLTPRQRDLILRYYEGKTSIKIQNRKLLAEELGIEINALRIRALRIRAFLEDCILRCLEAAPAAAK